MMLVIACILTLIVVNIVMALVMRPGNRDPMAQVIEERGKKIW